jgi:hypothetical protein
VLFGLYNSAIRPTIVGLMNGCPFHRSVGAQSPSTSNAGTMDRK